jgi:hypothetical protein
LNEWWRSSALGKRRHCRGIEVRNEWTNGQVSGTGGGITGTGESIAGTGGGITGPVHRAEERAVKSAMDGAQRPIAIEK